MTQLCEGTAEGSKDEQRQLCDMYFTGILDMNSAMKFGLKFQLFCPPKGFLIDQLRLVVVKSVKNHPEYLNEAFGSLAISALMEAFPCSRNPQDGR
jgi:hypothetical protein